MPIRNPVCPDSVVFHRAHFLFAAHKGGNVSALNVGNKLIWPFGRQRPLQLISICIGHFLPEDDTLGRILFGYGNRSQFCLLQHRNMPHQAGILAVMPHSVHILVCPHPVVFHRTHRLLAAHKSGNIPACNLRNKLIAAISGSCALQDIPFRALHFIPAHNALGGIAGIDHDGCQLCLGKAVIHSNRRQVHAVAAAVVCADDRRARAYRRDNAALAHRGDGWIAGIKVDFFRISHRVA